MQALEQVQYSDIQWRETWRVALIMPFVRGCGLLYLQRFSNLCRTGIAKLCGRENFNSRLGCTSGRRTAKIFEGDERVSTVSLHGKNNFPFRKQTSDWDGEFENDTGDEEYLIVLDEVLSKLCLQAFDLVFQAGVDALDSDARSLEFKS